MIIALIAIPKRIATQTCLKDKPDPISCASIVLINALESKAEKNRIGIFIAEYIPCKGARQIPKTKP